MTTRNTQQWKSVTLALITAVSLTAGCASDDEEFDTITDAWRSSSSLSYIGETGRVVLDNTVDSGASVVVNTRHSYTDPVVVAFINTRSGNQSVQVRVRAVTSSSFEVFMQEPDNQGHNPETISYIVMEKGRHTLDGGLTVEAGTVETSTTHVGGQAFGGDAVIFDDAFASTPAVLHTLNSHNNADFMASLATKVDAGGFEIGLESAETNKVPVSETVAWIALSTGSGTAHGSAFMIGVGNDGSNDGYDDTAHSISLTGFSAAPDLVASVYGENGRDGSWARGAGTWSASSQTVYTEEDQISDSERSHADETIAYAAFAPDTDLVAGGRSTRWRLRNASIPSSGQWAFRELSFCADEDCAVVLDGTAIDSGHAMGWAPAENAFDGDTSTMWKSTDADVEGQSWIGLELSSASDVRGVTIQTDNVVYASEDIYVEFYDADSGLWVTTDLLTDLAPSTTVTLPVSSTRSYFLVDESISGDDARAYCESLGTSLATITREDDNTAATDACAQSSDLLCWIGLSDADTEGAPEWVDGTPLSLELWNTRGSGDNSGSSRDCAVISHVDQSWIEYGSWQYGDCTQVDRPFACNGPAKTREYVAVDQSMNAEDAQAHCESLGEGYGLATITSAEENDTVAALCEGTGGLLCWIGLSDSVTEGSPEWGDGAPLIFESWNTRGNADNTGSSRDCAIIGGVDQSWMEYGGWQYNDCVQTERTFVCSRPVLQ